MRSSHKPMPRPLDCPACQRRGVEAPQSDDPIPEPVGQVGQLAGGLCGWCGGSGVLSTRVYRLFDKAQADLKAKLAPELLVEPEGGKR